VELAPSLDNRIRRWIQNPNAILRPYINPGMTILDVGCGPGYFSIEMATMVGPSGKVISADLQEGMLRQVVAKIKGTDLESRIRCVQCGKDSINVTEPVDFALAFYVVHEVPDKLSFFRQVKNILKPSGKFLLVEPKLFHVSRKEFEQTTGIAAQAGFSISPARKLMLSWSALLENTVRPAE